MGKKAAVAGHICLDITPVFTCNKSENISELLKPGKVVSVDDASISTGGVVANTGLAMKKLGVDTKLICKIGNDEFGDLVYSKLKKANATDYVIRTYEAFTSYSVVLAIPGVDRIFLHNPGTNNFFDSKDLSIDSLEDVALFHFGYPTLMKKMFENEGMELASMYRKVKECGIATSLDLAFVDLNTETGKIDWKMIFKQVMPYVDFFVPSIEEICALLEPERYQDWQLRAGEKDIPQILDFEKDIQPVADACMSLGVKVLLLKCGTLGLYLQTAGKDEVCNIGKKLVFDNNKWSNLSLFEKPYLPSKVRSATGAGDTCIAAFLTGILNNESPDICLKLAAGCGACCVEEYDALSGLVTYEELKKKINSDWKKLY